MNSALKKEGKWELAPAYDICHAYKPDHKWVSQHALSINGKRNNIQKEDLVQVAKSMSIKKAAQIITEINKHIKQWKKFANEAHVEKKLQDAIAATLINLEDAV